MPKTSHPIRWVPYSGLSGPVLCLEIQNRQGVWLYSFVSHKRRKVITNRDLQLLALAVPWFTVELPVCH